MTITPEQLKEWRELSKRGFRSMGRDYIQLLSEDFITHAQFTMNVLIDEIERLQKELILAGKGPKEQSK